MCDFLEMDPLLSQPSVYWKRVKQVYSYTVCCFLMFICYLSTVKKLCPSTVVNYISSVRYRLTESDVNTSCVDSSPYFKKVKVGIWNVYRASCPEVSKKTLPLSCDMVMYAISNMYNKNTEYCLCATTALVIMRCCLLRASETIPCPNSDHHLRSNDVMFEVIIKEQI